MLGFERYLKSGRKPVLIDITTSGNKTRRTCSIPWDCVEVLRCAPAYFSHRGTNQWSHNRTILIGDAAHVFPPFGAQGIANGIRDSLALSWRLALERRKGVDDAMTMTMRNGLLLSNKSGYIAAFLSVLGSALGYLPRLRDCIARRALMDNDGYAGLDRGFFLTGQHGAGKTAQIWFKMADGTILLSDHIFRESTSILTVLVLGSVTAQEASELKQVIDSGELPPNILAENVNYSLADLMIWRRWASRYSEATIRRPSEDDSIPQRATYWCVQTSSFPPRPSQLKSWQDNWVR
ncbi:Uncharacterized protein HZ326_24307 [Fusarium oxysporum f. sp. albedinis]|nr:Uncharacterized protein HZ326_24307 [Fusarium oxysporum f. sp. albedinis]